MIYEDRYCTAVRSSNLKSKPDTTFSDSDVLGAGGLAAKRAPLAMALLRLFSGDNHAAREIVQQLGAMADGKAYRLGVTMTRLECEDMGRSVLAWCRDGRCKVCGGHGFRLAGEAKIGEGRGVLSEHSCPACDRGRVPFDRQFKEERVELARWLRGQIEQEASKAGAMAMQSLAPRLDL